MVDESVGWQRSLVGTWNAQQTPPPYVYHVQGVLAQLDIDAHSGALSLKLNQGFPSEGSLNYGGNSKRGNH